MNRYDLLIRAMDWCFETSPWPIRYSIKLICTPIVYVAIVTALAIVITLLGVAVPLIAAALVAFLLFWMCNQLFPMSSYSGEVINIAPRKRINKQQCTITIRLEDGRRIKWNDCATRPPFRSQVTFSRRGLRNILQGDGFEDYCWGRIPTY